MPQATRRWISEKVKSLNESNVLPFHDILDAKMVNAALASAGVTFKERIYTPFVTLCMFLSQVLDPDHSCRAAVARLIVWLVVKGVIAPAPRIMRLFRAFSPSNPPESPSQEESSFASMLDTLESKSRSDGPPAGPRSIGLLPDSRSFLTVSAVA